MTTSWGATTKVRINGRPRLSPIAVAYAGAFAAVILGVTLACELIPTTVLCPDPAILFLIATAAALIGGLGMSRRFRRARHSLLRYVPDAVARHILLGNDPTGGERDVSVLFVDLRDYTSRVENSTPGQIHALLTRYTLAVSATIRQYGGSVVEFGGDGMMAVFGAPDFLADKERASIEAARAIVDTVGGLVESGGDADAERIEVGIGVASGPAFTGIIPAADRLVWSAVGNTTNLSSRLQALTRDLCVSIAIDETTWSKAGNIDAEFEQHLGLPIRGRTQGENVYTLSAEACSPSANAGVSRIHLHTGKLEAEARANSTPDTSTHRLPKHTATRAVSLSPSGVFHTEGILTKTRSALSQRDLNILRAFPKQPALSASNPADVSVRNDRGSTSDAEPIAVLETTAKPAFACTEDGCIIAWNPCMETLLEYPAQQVLGKHCWKILQGRDVFGNLYCCESCDVGQSLLHDEPVRSFELDIRKASGKTVRVIGSTLAVRGNRGSRCISIHLLRPTHPSRLTAHEGNGHADDAQRSPMAGEVGFEPTIP